MRRWLIACVAVWPSACSSPPPPVDPGAEAQVAANGHGDGASCIEATEADREDLERTPPKEGDQLEALARTVKEVIKRAPPFGSCNVGPSSKVSICAAVRDGATLGVTVGVEPGTLQQADCIADSVRGMTFPSHPTLVVANIRFEPNPQ